MPVWLSPIQVVVIPITDNHVNYAKKVVEEFNKAEIRVKADTSGERMEYKIRQATLNKIPYILNVGDKELESKTIAVRSRGNKVEFGVNIPDFINKILKEIENYQ